MGGNSQEIIGGFAALLLIMGIIILVPSLPALIYAEYEILPVFVVPAMIAIASGTYLSTKHPLAEELSIRATIIIASAGWIFVSAIGAIPYMGIGMGWLDAFFESISGFTTTGMTLIPILEECPRAILFWRSLTQWVGGVGIILLFTTMLKGSMSTWRLYALEGGREKFTPSVKESVKNILIIYTFLTAVCAIVLYACGMGAFDAINHAMTALSTGGFSTRTSSIAEFNPTIKITLGIFMILGATSFVLLYNLIKLDAKKIVGDPEFKTMIFILVLGGAAVSTLLLSVGGGFFNGIIDGFFNVISILTTTGYTSANINLWPGTAKAIMLILMIIGGSAGSTAGGIKVWRFVVLFKILKREVEKITFPPSAVIPVKIGEKVLDDEYIMKIEAFIFSYTLLVLLSFLALSFTVPDLFGTLSLVISAVSNVGPAFYPVFELDAFSKSILIIGMWAGRLELLPAIAFVAKELPSTVKEFYLEKRRKRSGS
ncbi:MAG: TrkH family potassium uptake protein [Candidatus Methanomethylicaceae archaeon]